MSVNRKRNIQVKFWVNIDEYNKILEKIKVSKIPIGRYMRNAALKREIIIYDLTSIFELSAQISRIGNNINQIAKKLNQGGLINKSEIKYLKDTMGNINEVLIEVYQDIQATQDKG